MMQHLAQSTELALKAVLCGAFLLRYVFAYMAICSHPIQLFSHLASDVELKPLAHFANADTLAKYPPMKTGAYVKRELNRIKLAK